MLFFHATCFAKIHCPPVRGYCCGIWCWPAWTLSSKAFPIFLVGLLLPPPPAFLLFVMLSHSLRGTQWPCSQAVILVWDVWVYAFPPPNICLNKILTKSESVRALVVTLCTRMRTSMWPTNLFLVPTWAGVCQCKYFYVSAMCFHTVYCIQWQPLWPFCLVPSRKCWVTFQSPCPLIGHKQTAMEK